MRFEEYWEEIELMIRQNYTEYDMYSVIAALMREGKNIKKLSLRDVNRRRGSTARGRVFFGLSSIPDFVILDKEFVNSENWEDNIEKVYGCVEIKGFDKELLSIQSILGKVKNEESMSIEEEQILGEIFWYKKVLYTNGRVWKYLRLECESYSELQRQIRSFVRRRTYDTNVEAEFCKWYEDGEIDLNKVSITESYITNKEIPLSRKTTEDDWKKFLDELYKIDWCFKMN